MTTTAYRTCHLCEATCGLELHLDGGEITLVRGDRDDVFSRRLPLPEGHRAQAPRRRPRPPAHAADPRAATTWREVDVGRSVRGDRPSASARSATRTATTRSRSTSATRTRTTSARCSTTGVLLQALGSRNVYSASTVDQMPKQVSAGLMFGAALSVPVPDIDRTDYLLMLGANPFASNGSLWTAPDLPGRLRGAARARRQVRRRRPAPERRPPRRPTSTSRSGPAPTRCSCSRSCTCCSPRTSSISARSPPHVDGVDDVRRGSRASSRPSASRMRTGVDAGARSGASRASSRPRRRPRSTGASARARRSSARSRPGSSTCCNVLTGNLDRPGGAMFAKPAAGGANTGGTPGAGRGVRFGRRALARARAARVLRRAAGRLPRRGDRDAGRRSGPRARHDRRQPGALDARLATGSTARSPRSSSW